MQTRYDFIIIGTGAGGGTIAQKLAKAGKKFLFWSAEHFFHVKRKIGAPRKCS